MSGWKALNIDSDDDDDQYNEDDSKELQVEEGFKLYQNALKLHSQGPLYFDQAREAYRELFALEVFKHPEAVSALDEEQADNVGPLQTNQIGLNEDTVAITGTTDNANALPQLVYLANKSRAQFVIDVARSTASASTTASPAHLHHHYKSAASSSIKDASAALEHDDTDLDLWKRAARVADTLTSSRLTRFCLESVLAGDDEADDVVDLAGLDEAFAQDELQESLATINDDLSKLKSSSAQPRPLLRQILRDTNDPYPFLPRTSKRLMYVDEKRRPLLFATGTTHLELSAPTHLAVAQALLDTLRAHQAGHGDLPAGATVRFITKSSRRASSNTRVTTSQESVSPVVRKDRDAEVLDVANSLPEMTIDTSGGLCSIDEDIDTEGGKRSPHPEDIMETFDLPVVKDETLLLDEVDLPSRKRSSAIAGNDEPEARGRSKRIKARESLVGANLQEDEVLPDPTSLYQEQHLNIQSADQTLFYVFGDLLDKLDIGEQNSAEGSVISPLRPVRQQDWASNNTLEDLQNALLSWDEAKNSLLLSGRGVWDQVEASTGRSLFLQHIKNVSAVLDVVMTPEEHSAVLAYTQLINDGCFSVHEALFQWLLMICEQRPNSKSSMYTGSQWSLELKETVAEILKIADQAVRTTFGRYVIADSSCSQMQRYAEFVQSIFELHLDIQSSITSLPSVSHDDQRRDQSLRLTRWAEVLADTVTITEGSGTSLPRALMLRYLWSSVVYVQLTQRSTKEHILLLLHDLLTLLRENGDEEIRLPNSTAMPCISPTAAEQEIHKLKTLDFFLSVFEIDDNDPLAVILKLEPILEYETEVQHHALPDARREQIEEFRAFLTETDVSLVLMLWRRLQNAYVAISYPTKVVSCLLRSVQTIVKELNSNKFNLRRPSERQHLLVQWLRAADLLITSATRHSTSDLTCKHKAFYSFNDTHLRESIRTVCSVMQILYGFVQTDDALRMNHVSPPAFKNLTASRQFEKARDRFREMYVQSWTILYLLSKQAVLQLLNNENKPDRIVSGLLRVIHNSLGERQYCKYNSKTFIQLAKTELFSFDAEEDLSLDIAQVLFDLYGIRVTAGYGDIDHGCQAGSLRDKQTAHLLVPILMDYARRHSMKELLRGELKNTIDKVQAVIGQNKSTKGLASNRKVVSAYLKSPIKPQVLYDAVRGIGELITKDVEGESADLAACGWYLLLGNMTLAKYRSIKRVNPTPAEDLDTAASYLRQDIDHKATNWESWYRLAQIYDLKIEDDLIWGSTKINDNRADIISLERSAINAYSMAIALSTRLEAYDLGTITNINNLCYDFAMRLYSSSRPPLNMEVFNSDKRMRHVSDRYSQAMSKQPLIVPMNEYAVWRLTAYLLRRSISQGGTMWQRHYLLGKCLWKMSRAVSGKRGKNSTHFSGAVESFQTAVEQVPRKDKSADPILEPHFKLVSTLHKLVAANELAVKDAVKELEATPYAKGVNYGNEQSLDDWHNAVLAILKKLQVADKSGWHHRITARAAQIKASEDTDEEHLAGAIGAKQEFQNQIFHRNMTLQVWKPENERPGRHYVYTGRYLRFFVDVLVKLRDRTNLEQVVRRIRRKTTDFINHELIWEQTVTSYIDLLRQLHAVPRGHERAVFDNTSFDEFNRLSEKLEAWAHDPTTTMSLLDALRDTVEMKKLNNSLMKGPTIDDMIGDTYAMIYQDYVSGLSVEEKAPPPPVPVLLPPQVGSTPLLSFDGQSTNRMALNNLLSGQLDGVSSSGTTAPANGGLGISIPQSLTNVVSEVDTAKPERAKPGRAKTITRREVQKKAEAVIVKPPPIKTPTLSKRLIVDIPATNKRQLRGDQDADSDGGSVIGNLETASQLGSRQNTPAAHHVPSREDGSVASDDNDDDNDGDDEIGMDGDGDNEEDEDESDRGSMADKHQSVQRSLFAGLGTRPSKDQHDETDGISNPAMRMDDPGGTHTPPSLQVRAPIEDIEIADSQDGPDNEHFDRAAAGTR